MRLVIQMYDVRVVVPATEPYPGVDVRTQLKGGASPAIHVLQTQLTGTNGPFRGYEGTGQVSFALRQRPLASLSFGGSTAIADLNLSGYVIPQQQVEGFSGIPPRKLR
jgi:hypothetical protein